MTAETIAANLAAVRARIAAACARAGREPGDVRLLPVSKTRPASEVRDAHAAGVARFAENRAQEGLEKAEALADSGVEWAMIGHLQLNKAKLVARFAAEFQALDSVELAAELDRRAGALGRQLDVLIQVNTSGEATKSGLAPAGVTAFARELRPFDALRVRGLMTIAAPSADRAVVAPCFATLRAAQAALRDQGTPGQDYEELSMGMSGDFELAVEHGATVVRIGTAIFGPRVAAG